MCVIPRAPLFAKNRRCQWALLLLAALSTDARATNIRWNVGNGTFHTGSNWQGGVAPAVLDVAQFGRSAAPFQFNYTVSFTVDAANQAIQIEDDAVTFDLNGRIYTATAASSVIVGNQPSGLPGSLTVTDGAINSTTNIDVGAAAGTSGTLIVSTGGLLSGTPSLNVGKLGAGTLTVQQGGDVSGAASTTVGVGTGIAGTATIIGAGSTLVTAALSVGNTGNGTVDVQLGGLLQNNADALVGAGNLFTGVGTAVVNVTGVGSQWKSLGLLEIGDGGAGKVNIANGGKLTTAETVIGVITSSNGEVNVNGASSLWDNAGDLTIGSFGAGALNIANQGVVETDTAYVGFGALAPLHGDGTVAVSGAGSQWNVAGRLQVGFDGTGALNITNGAAVHAGEGYVGVRGVGAVAVAGDDSLWDSPVLQVGVAGTGTLNITAGATVQTDEGLLGRRLNGDGHVTVDGAGSLWDVGLLTVASEGDGTLEITGGGKLLTSSGKIAVASVGAGDTGLNGTGHVLISGAGSLWQSAGAIFVGRSAGGGDATLEITSGGKVQVAAHSVIEKGLLKVDGAGSLWTNNDQIVIGNDATGAVEITAGGTVSNRGAIVGFRSPSATESQGTVTVGSAVAGAASTWQIEGQLGVGYDFVALHNSGVGKVFIQPGGAVTATQDISVSFGDLLRLEGGTLTAPRIRFPDGGTDANFQWTSGTLHVIEFDGSLINQGGVLAPANTTNIQGNYTQLAPAILEIGIGGTTQAAQYDFVHVTANAILGGTLKLDLTGGFVPAVDNTFTILDADLSILNPFANVANGQRLATTNGLGSFVVNYGAGSLFDPSQIVLSSFLLSNQGDFDHDGDVDGNDFLVWQRGESPNPMSAADLAAWRGNFGLPGLAATGTTVPEPSALWLAVALVISSSISQRRRSLGSGMGNEWRTQPIAESPLSHRLRRWTP